MSSGRRKEGRVLEDAEDSSDNVRSELSSLMKGGQSKLIILEGNISAGKSTLADSLAQKLKMKVVLEPTNQNPYLEKFYEAPSVWGLRMQIWLLRVRYITYLSALRHMVEKKTSVILDRSVFSDWVFAEQGHRDGFISDEGYRYYKSLRHQMLHGLPVPDAVVYLDVDPEECYNRLHNFRGRKCESGIPLVYLEGLHQCYQVWLKDMEKQGSKMLRLAWNEFGNLEHTADRIADLPTLNNFNDFMTPWGQLGEFIKDKSLMNKSMHLDHECEELSATEEIVKPTLEMVVSAEKEEMSNLQMEKKNSAERRRKVLTQKKGNGGSVTTLTQTDSFRKALFKEEDDGVTELVEDKENNVPLVR